MDPLEGYSIPKIMKVESSEVECPRCKALPGEPCRQPSGKKYEYDHKERCDIAPITYQGKAVDRNS